MLGFLLCPHMGLDGALEGDDESSLGQAESDPLRCPST